MVSFHLRLRHAQFDLKHDFKISYQVKQLSGRAATNRSALQSATICRARRALVSYELPRAPY
jgi:hypothetical protein